MTIESVLLWVAGGLFSATAALALFRIVRGPSMLDRMIASDVLLTTLLLVVGGEMVLNGHTRSIPLMLVLAGVAIFATVAVARYVGRQAPPEPTDDGDEPAGEAR